MYICKDLGITITFNDYSMYDCKTDEISQCKCFPLPRKNASRGFGYPGQIPQLFFQSSQPITAFSKFTGLFHGRLHNFYSFCDCNTM